MNNLTGKVAIITGASGGMGSETACLLGKNGVNLLLAAKGVEKLEEVADKIDRSGGEAVVCPTDVSEEKDVHRMVKTALDHFKRLDFLICTAGVGIFGPTETFSAADWDRVMDVNLKGPFLCCKAVLPEFMKRKRGHIINIASLAGTVGSANLGAYGASKAGLIRFSESLSQEVRSHDIKVSTICPGSTNTGFGGSKTEKRSWKIAPEDIAFAVYNLLSSRDNLLISEVHMRPLKTSL